MYCTTSFLHSCIHSLLESRVQVHTQEKYKYVIHAEANAIYNAGKLGIKLEGTSIYVCGLPVCSKCALAISQVGINRVIIPQQLLLNIPDRWVYEWELSKSILLESNIKVEPHYDT